MALRQLEGVTRNKKVTSRDVTHNGGELKRIVSSHTRRKDNSASPEAFILPPSPKRGDGRGNGPTRSAHLYGYSLPILNEHANQLLKFERLELGRDSEGRQDEKGASEDVQHEKRFGKGLPARTTGRDGATSRNLKGRDALPQGSDNELPLQCRSMPLTAKNPENCSRRMTFDPKEKYYNEPLSGARPHYAQTSALRCRPRYAPGRTATWDHSFSGGGDVARSHLLTHLSDPFHRPSGSRRSFGDPGPRRVALSNKKAWGASNYSEPIASPVQVYLTYRPVNPVLTGNQANGWLDEQPFSSPGGSTAARRAFTYIDRVLRWLRKVPGYPLVNRIDCDGMSQDTMGLSPLQASTKTTGPSRLSQPGSAWLQPCRTADLTWSTQPQNLPDAVLSPQRSTPRVPAARSALYRPLLSPRYPLPCELDEGSYEQCSADGQFYPLNLIPSISHEKVEDGAHIFNRSPRPPNPSPCSIKCHSLADMTSGHLAGRKYSYSSVEEELSFNSAECTHDVCSVNELVSPEPLEPPEPKHEAAKTLMIDVQPMVSVRYKKQKQAVKMRPVVVHMRAGKPPRRVPRHIITRKKTKKSKKEPLVAPPMPFAKCEKERKPRRAPKKKKKTTVASEIRNCIRLLRSKSRKRHADRSEFVLRDLSSPCSVSSSEYSLTVIEAFQQVVSMTAQMKLDAAE